jgi:hypothetical protein
MDSPDARLIQASVGVHLLVGGCGTNNLPRDDHLVPPWSVGDICPQGGPRVFESGILNPAFFGTTHTCSHLALGSRIVSSHDVMGVEVGRSEVQSIRLDWDEGQTEMHVHTCSK